MHTSPSRTCIPVRQHTDRQADCSHPAQRGQPLPCQHRHSLQTWVYALHAEQVCRVRRRADATCVVKSMSTRPQRNLRPRRLSSAGGGQQDNRAHQHLSSLHTPSCSAAHTKEPRCTPHHTVHPPAGLTGRSFMRTSTSPWPGSGMGCCATVTAWASRASAATQGSGEAGEQQLARRRLDGRPLCRADSGGSGGEAGAAGPTLLTPPPPARLLGVLQVELGDVHHRLLALGRHGGRWLPSVVGLSLQAGKRLCVAAISPAAVRRSAQICLAAGAAM